MPAQSGFEGSRRRYAQPCRDCDPVMTRSACSDDGTLCRAINLLVMLASTLQIRTPSIIPNGIVMSARWGVAMKEASAKVESSAEMTRKGYVRPTLIKGPLLSGITAACVTSGPCS
jgi:hypothetical protein